MAIFLRRASLPSSPGLRASPLRLFLGAFLIFVSLGSIWAFASPVSSVPDELAHVIKAAAVVRGQWQGGSSEQQGAELLVDVPAYLKQYPKPPCFAFKAEQPASCTPPIGRDMAPTRLPTSAGNYNPLYYAIVGIPSVWLAGNPAWYAMRIVSAVLSAIMLASAFLGLARLRRPKTAIAAFAVSMTPMVLYFTGGVNPQALEIVSTISVFANMLVVLEHHRELARYRANVVLLAVSAVVLANTRALSLVWLALVVLAALFFAGWKSIRGLLAHRSAIAAVAITTGGAAIGLVWLTTANSLQNLTGTPSTVPKAQALQTMFDRTFDYATAYISQLGWLDVNGPNATIGMWAFLIGGIVVCGLCARPHKQLIALAVLILPILFLPPVMQAAAIQDVGYIWQGRYVLPLVVPFIVACGYALRFYRWPAGPLAGRTVALLLALGVTAHAYTFVYALRRYMVGIGHEANWDKMISAPSWQPPFGWLPWSIAYAAVLILAAVSVRNFLNRSTPIPLQQATARRRHSGATR